MSNLPRAEVFRTNTEAVEYLLTISVIRHSYNCVCGSQMSLINIKDGEEKNYFFRCTNRNNCGTRKSLISHTVFKGSGKSLATIMNFIYYFINDSLYHQYRDFLEITDQTISN